MDRWLAPAMTLSAAVFFWLAVALQSPDKIQRQESHASVAVSAPIQVLLYAGDRFLAADIESIRTTAAVTDKASQNYRVRAHEVVSQLNPCHEDNYWIGNASLSWGGAPDQSIKIQNDAMHCRFWDEWPAFFYGFNQYFFQQNIPEARRALELAAERSPDNAAAFRTFSIMLAAGKIDNTRMALKMLQGERDKAKDPALRKMLDKRVVRLKGLLTLRDAQAIYEKRFGKPLEQPQELLDNGLLKNFPDDPLKLGYEFRDHTFHLHKLQVK